MHLNVTRDELLYLTRISLSQKKDAPKVTPCWTVPPARVSVKLKHHLFVWWWGVTWTCFFFPDINECEVFPSICQGGGLCVNVEGSFQCNCPPHLTLDPTGRNCYGNPLLSGNISGGGQQSRERRGWRNATARMILSVRTKARGNH